MINENTKEEYERLTKEDGDYCRDVCGMSTCKRISETGRRCSDAYRYSRLREYEDIGMSPSELKELMATFRQMSVGKNHVA